MKVAVYITYNDFETIGLSIPSIYDKVDRIIAVDGRFKDFNWEGEISTDGTLEYLKILPKVEVIIAPNLTEPDKRSVYFDPLKEGDLVLNLDGDEVLEGDIPELDTDIGAIRIGEYGDDREKLRYNRFFIYRKGLHYWGKHYLIRDNQDRRFCNLKSAGAGYSSKIIKDFRLVNNAFLRTEARKKAKGTYYGLLVNRETKIADE
jgi:hypothetical protein